MCVCVCTSVRTRLRAYSVMSDSFVTPGTVACQAVLSMGFSRQEHWSGAPCPPPGALPDPGADPASLASPTLGRWILHYYTTWEAHTEAYINDSSKTKVEGHLFCTWLLKLRSHSSQPGESPVKISQHKTQQSYVPRWTRASPALASHGRGWFRAAKYLFPPLLSDIHHKPL